MCGRLDGCGSIVAAPLEDPRKEDLLGRLLSEEKRLVRLNLDSSFITIWFLVRRVCWTRRGWEDGMKEKAWVAVRVRRRVAVESFILCCCWALSGGADRGQIGR